MEIFATVFSVLLLIGAGSGFQWSDKLGEGKGPLQVCSGHDIQLLWNFTLDSRERVKGMEWIIHTEGKEEEVLATYKDHHFVPIANFSGRLVHLQGGGLELSCATFLESGNYSIAVSTEDADRVLSLHRRTIGVLVPDTPKTDSGEIHIARKEKAEPDVTSGALHVQLLCGNFSDRGHPPVDVIWTTPRGERLNSSSYEDGFFRLLVPNPPVAGNYCCSIPPSLPAAKCLAGDSPLLDTVCVEVEEIAARFSLLEARYSVLEARYSLVEDRQRGFATKTVVEDMANRTEVLEQWIDDAPRSLVPVYFHVRLSSDINLSSGSILIVDDVLSNHGEGYDPDTGYFTAPLTGSYVFMVSTGSYSDSTWSNVQMMKEGAVVAQTYEYRRSTYDMASCQAVLSLAAGERVWLQSSKSNSFFDSYMTYFTGFRI